MPPALSCVLIPRPSDGPIAPESISLCVFAKCSTQPEFSPRSSIPTHPMLAGSPKRIPSSQFDSAENYVGTSCLPELPANLLPGVIRTLSGEPRPVNSSETGNAFRRPIIIIDARRTRSTRLLKREVPVIRANRLRRGRLFPERYLGYQVTDETRPTGTTKSGEPSPCAHFMEDPARDSRDALARVKLRSLFLGAQDRILRRFRDAEFNDPLRRNLDLFTCGRIASNPSLAIYQHQFTDPRKREGVLRVLVGKFHDDVHDLRRLFFADPGRLGERAEDL